MQGVTEHGGWSLEVRMTDGLAHAGSRDVGLRLQGESEVAFRIHGGRGCGGY